MIIDIINNIFLRASSYFGKMSDRVDLSPIGPKFGIDALPDGFGNLRQAVSIGILIPSPSMANSWMVTCLNDLLISGSVFMVSEDRESVDALLQHSSLRNSFLEKKINVLLTKNELAKEVDVHGIQCVIDELAVNGLKSEQTLLWVGSHDWLDDLSFDQLRVFSIEMDRWCASRMKPSVFVFLRSKTEVQPEIKLNKILEIFQNVAALTIDRRWPVLSFVRWSNENGVSFDLNFGLTVNSSTDRLSFNGSITKGRNNEIIAAHDKGLVIATQAAVGFCRSIPNNWKILNHAGEGALAVANSLAATIVLHAGAIDDFQVLIRVVHHLRKTHPRTFKIVVRENDAKLRFNTERALIYFGANLVIYKEIGFSRLAQMVDDICGQTFDGKCDLNYDEALSSFTPDEDFGYLTASLFCSTVSKTLARTELSGMTHTVVRLNLLPIIPHLDVLNCCSMFRGGDFFTADRNSFFIFLFACSEIDVDMALQRIFSKPLDQLFASQIFESSLDEIELILNDIKKSISEGIPDYSSYLFGHEINPMFISSEKKRPGYLPTMVMNLPTLDVARISPVNLLNFDVKKPDFISRSILRRKLEIDDGECFV